MSSDVADVVMRYARDTYDKANVAERTDGLEIAGPRLRADALALEQAAALIRQLTADLAAAGERERVMGVALRRLAFWAQTSGGTAGRDEQLVAAIDVAIEALRMHDTARAALAVKP